MNNLLEDARIWREEIQPVIDRICDGVFGKAEPMSSTTHVILNIHNDRHYHQSISRINIYLETKRLGQLAPVRSPPHHDRTGATDTLQFSFPGGTKHWELNTFMGCFNYLNLIEFLEVLANEKWSDPSAVQVMYQCQHDEHFTMMDMNQVALFIQDQTKALK